MGYLFDSVDVLVNYLFTKGKFSPLKLQTSLYFLYAYYGASYGSILDEEVRDDFGNTYPERLFPGGFVATNYGPSIEDVKQKLRNGTYRAIPLPRANYDVDVLHYLDNLISQLLKASDFALVEKSSTDNHFKAAHPGAMDNDEIIYEYRRTLNPDRVN